MPQGMEKTKNTSTITPILQSEIWLKAGYANKRPSNANGWVEFNVITTIPK
jgi:hypothetical protein